MNKPRRFKTRNGSILEEYPGDKGRFQIIESTDLDCFVGEDVYLVVNGGGSPPGRCIR